MSNTLTVEYEQNFSNWVEQHIALLKAGQLHKLDIEHLIEELEGMASRDRNELVSHLVILIAHLLKWQFQLKQLSEDWQNFTGKSWRASIIEQRSEIQVVPYIDLTGCARKEIYSNRLVSYVIASELYIYANQYS